MQLGAGNAAVLHASRVRLRRRLIGSCSRLWLRSMRRTARGAIAIALAFRAASVAAAQSTAPVVIDDALACPRCTITTRTLATLGTTDGPGSMATIAQTVTADRLDRYWVVGGEELILVSDASGRFLQAVGRQGDGPGEIRRPLEAILLPGDSMLVLDGTRRAVVFDAQFTPRRTVRLPGAFFPAVLAAWPSSVIAHGEGGDAAGSGWPLHQLSFVGNAAEVAASFGPDAREPRPERAWLNMQKVAHAGGGGFWSGYLMRYQLTHWAGAGQKGESYERRPAWFAGHMNGSLGNRDKPPEPVLRALLEDSAGLLWVFISVPAPTWREAWSGVRGRDVSIRQIAHEKLFHTTVEVIDPRARRVVARQTLPAFVFAAFAERRAATYTVDRNDTPHVEIIAFTLSGR